MSISDAFERAVKRHPDRLQKHKRDKTTREAALRIEEHAYHRASNIKGGKKS